MAEEGIGMLIRPWVRKQIAATALNGVPIRYPTISPITNRWMLFNPITNAYEDSGYVARGVSPTINMATGTWEVWNDATQQYEDSGFLVTGPPGQAGKSAYQIWLDEGNAGTQQDFLASLAVQGVGTPESITNAEIQNILNNL